MNLKALGTSTLFMVATLLITSCSPRLVGTWTVQRYETAVPGQQGVVLSNIGTIKFSRNGSGEKKINYSVLGITRDDQIPFQWNWIDGKYVTITGGDSEFAKTWIIMTNKSGFQKWKSTDGTNNIQILELTK